jgi:hypothetical protein
MWNYRLVKQSSDLYDYISICEVYYDEEKRPAMYCEATIGGDTLDEVKEVYKMVKEAFKAPTLTYPKDFTGSIDRE